MKFLFFPAYPTYQIFIAGGIALVLTIILTPLWIKFLQERSIGQVVRADGPEHHLRKQGTPTMGGLMIILTAALSFIFIGQSRGITVYGWLALFTTLMFAVVGFVDDYLKVIKVRSLGLNARSKIILEVVVSIAFCWLAFSYLDLTTKIALPFTPSQPDLGWIYYILIILIFVSTTNSVNLTDGLDGLAAGTVTVVALAFGGIAFRQDHLDLAIYAGSIGGACIGFIWYNAYPAEIFMGDSGSIALGGALAALAVLTKTEIFLIVIGGIYVFETLSVIMQIISFRFFGRRIFKMAPLHHHFEMQGWSETKVMVRFLIFTAFLAGYGFSLYFMSTP